MASIRLPCYFKTKNNGWWLAFEVCLDLYLGVNLKVSKYEVITKIEMIKLSLKRISKSFDI